MVFQLVESKYIIIMIAVVMKGVTTIPPPCISDNGKYIIN